MDRREFFSWMRDGGCAAAASLLLRDGTLQAGVPGKSSPRAPHIPPRATRAIHICLCGAMSHVHSFDYKPGLIAAHHGRSLKLIDEARCLLRAGGAAAQAGLGVSSSAAEAVCGSPARSRIWRKRPTS